MSARLPVWASALLLACVLAGTLSPGMAATPAVQPGRVPVVIVDAGLGDAAGFIGSWLGTDAVQAAELGSGPTRLWTSGGPKWWGGGDAPPTFVLASTSDTGGAVAGPITAKEIAWGLDTALRRSGQRKAVLVAQGIAGLQARAYLQDVGDAKQSSRADVVGVVFLGTPNVGTSLQQIYPDLDLWSPAAAACALQAGDLLPGSPFLGVLNAPVTRVPAACRVLIVRGTAFRPGGKDSDGLIAKSDSVIPTVAVWADPQVVDGISRASDGWDLRGTWYKRTQAGGASQHLVLESEVEKLSLHQGYATDQAVRDAVRTAYESWMASGVSVTHISSRLVLDVSGSMGQKWQGGKTKLEAAMKAAADFVAALRARVALQPAPPEDIGLVVFNQRARVVVGAGSPASDVPRELKKVRAGGNTNVGAALRAALDSFRASPEGADKSVLLLSDGVPTVGATRAQILRGEVARARTAGVKIHVIAFGGMGESDKQFLRRVAQGTSGQYHQASNPFELRREFVRARFVGLGALGLDQEIAKATTVEPLQVGTVGNKANRLEIAVVTDRGTAALTLKRDGFAAQAKDLKEERSDDGTVLLTVPEPKPGVYTLEVAGEGGATRAHAFAVAPVDVLKDTRASAAVRDSSVWFLGAIALIAVAAVATTVVLSRRGRRGSEPEE